VDVRLSARALFRVVNPVPVARGIWTIIPTGIQPCPKEFQALMLDE